MQEKIDYAELEKSLIKIKELSEKVKSNLLCIDSIIDENINSGVGILDGNSGELFKKKWDYLKEDIPTSIMTFQNQVDNLELFISSYKKEDN